MHTVVTGRNACVVNNEPFADNSLKQPLIVEKDPQLATVLQSAFVALTATPTTNIRAFDKVTTQGVEQM